MQMPSIRPSIRPSHHPSIHLLCPRLEQEQKVGGNNSNLIKSGNKLVDGRKPFKGKTAQAAVVDTELGREKGGKKKKKKQIFLKLDFLDYF